MIQLDQNTLITSALGALGVIFGVVTKNSSKTPLWQLIGTMLFVVGWLTIGWVLAKSTGRPALSWLSAIGIMGSAMAMRLYMDKGVSPPMILPLIFVVGWLTLGVVSGKGDRQSIIAGVVAAMFVLASMMYFLPRQRASGNADGPGMPLFTIAWAIVVFLLSKK